MGKKQQKSKEISPEKDSRVITTRNIWGMTIGILGVCIPLSSVTKSGPILPLTAIAGTAISTIAVWHSDEKKLKSQVLLSQQLETLQQRLANLETIVSSDDFELNQKIKDIEITEQNKPSKNQKPES